MPQDTPEQTPEPSQARSARTRQRNTQAKAELLRQLQADPDSAIARLPIKRLRFIIELIRTNNITEAARLAGFSEKTAAQIGYNLFRNVQVVRDAVKERIAHTLAQPAASGKEITLRMATRARSDIGDLADCYTPDGNFDLQKAKDLGLSCLIKEINHFTYPSGIKRTTVKLYSALEADKILGKWSGLEVAESKNPADIAREERERDRNREWAESEVTRLCEAVNRGKGPDDEQVTREQMVEIIRARGGALAAVLLGGECEQMIEVESIN